jgi:hypothetical protein
MLSKLLAASFVGLFVAKLLFRPRLRALGRWFDGAINAMLIAIGCAYAIHLVIWLTG